MREILFRAKTEPNCKDAITGKIIKNPKWIYGSVDLGYMHDCKVPLISDEKGNKIYKCQYETIGQFTGLTDKNGKKIFEGDILQFNYTGKNLGVEGKAAVIFENGKFGVLWGWHKEFVCLDGFANTTIEVIGNIHDNPELLEVDNEFA